MWNEWQADEWMDRHCWLTDKLFDGGRWSQMKKKILSANHAYNFCTLGTGCMATAVIWTSVCKIYCRGGPDLNRNILFMTNDWQIDVFVFPNHRRACAQSCAKNPSIRNAKRLNGKVFLLLCLFVSQTDSRLTNIDGSINFGAFFFPQETKMNLNLNWILLAFLSELLCWEKQQRLGWIWNAIVSCVQFQILQRRNLWPSAKWLLILFVIGFSKTLLRFFAHCKYKESYLFLFGVVFISVTGVWFFLICI